MENTISEDRTDSNNLVKNSEFSIPSTCESCKYFSRKKDECGRVRRYGVCRCHSPDKMGFPWVYSDDWCAEGIEI